MRLEIQCVLFVGGLPATPKNTSSLVFIYLPPMQDIPRQPSGDRTFHHLQAFFHFTTPIFMFLLLLEEHGRVCMFLLPEKMTSESLGKQVVPRDSRDASKLLKFTNSSKTRNCADKPLLHEGGWQFFHVFHQRKLSHSLDEYEIEQPIRPPP